MNTDRFLCKAKAKNYNKKQVDKWIYGTGYYYDGVNTWITANPDNKAIAMGVVNRTVDPSTLCQCTGLNGCLKWEGNKLLDKRKNDRIWVIKWIRGGFHLVQEGCGFDYTIEQAHEQEFELLGNIHDNA